MAKKYEIQSEHFKAKEKLIANMESDLRKLTEEKERYRVENDRLKQQRS